MQIFNGHFYWFLAYIKNKYDLQVYLDNCAYKFIGKQIIDYLGKNTFEADEN